MQYLSLLAALLSAFELVTTAPLPESEATTVSNLITANGQAERVNMLSDTDFVFDFFNPLPGSVSSSGPDGRITVAQLRTFPALVDQGISMAVGYLGPCGLNTPHIHPRATEFNFAVNGTLHTGMIQENGARLVLNNVTAGQATIFPRGSIHFEQNMGCEPMIFIAAFSSEDPGTTSVANAFFRLPMDIVEAAMGREDLSKSAEQVQMGIPESVAFGIQECMQRCGISRTASDTKSTTSGASDQRSRGRLSLFCLTGLMSAVIVWLL